MLDKMRLTVHDMAIEIDLNRTTIAFSGESIRVSEGLLGLAELILPRIDLNRHVSIFPRTGALDRCPVTPLENFRSKIRAQRFKTWVEETANTFATTYQVPVFLCDRSEVERAESELFLLRKGGFGGLIDRELSPDFGPTRANSLLGISFFGWRDFVLNINVIIKSDNSDAAKRIANKIRMMRSEGDPRMIGVKSLGASLPSREASVLSLQLTLPEATPPDLILEFVRSQVEIGGHEILNCELEGVIRSSDLPFATLLYPRLEQIITIKVNV